MEEPRGWTAKDYIVAFMFLMVLVFWAISPGDSLVFLSMPLPTWFSIIAITFLLPMLSAESPFKDGGNPYAGMVLTIIALILLLAATALASNNGFPPSDEAVEDCYEGKETSTTLGYWGKTCEELDEMSSDFYLYFGVYCMGPIILGIFGFVLLGGSKNSGPVGIEGVSNMDEAGRNIGDKALAGVSFLIAIIGAAILLLSLINSSLTVSREDVVDCFNGETTPEELGLPGMTCVEIGEAYDSDAFMLVPSLFTTCCCGGLGIFMMWRLAKQAGTSLEVKFAAAERESEELREQIHAISIQLMDAEDGYQEAIEEQRRAEERHREFERERQDLSIPSEINDAVVRAHRERMDDLEASAAKAMAEIEDARAQVEEARRTREEALNEADKIRTAEEQLRRITGLGDSSATVNITHEERIYQDSVHQEKRPRDEDPGE